MVPGTAESGRGLTIRPGAQGGRTRVLYVVAELVKNPRPKFMVILPLCLHNEVHQR
eukprot:SAG11_NODE_9099_length_943_cov_12.991706_1_plen_55_part_10